MGDSSIKFRKTALANLSAAEQLDQLISITSSKSWIILLTLCGLLLAAVIWGVIGSIPVRVHGQGILLVEKGTIHAAVAPEGIGRVTHINVKTGEQVREDQVVALLENSSLAKQVKVSNEYLLRLQQKHRELSELAKQQISERQQQLAKQSAILQRVIDSEKDNLMHLDELLKIKRESFAKGITTKEELINTVQNYNRSKGEIERAKDRITSNKIEESNYIDQWQERIRNLDLKIKDEQYKLNNLTEKLKLSSEIRSPIAGIVTSIRKSIGQVAENGVPVVSIASLGQGMDAVIYLPAEEGKLVKSEMTALVSPATVKQEEFGSIRGKVISVSAYPTSEQAMLALLHNENLVKQFAKSGAPIAVRVRLQQDKYNSSGFSWSSSKGPESQVTPGTLATAKITVRKQAPLSLIIPTFKKMLGG